MKCNGYEKGIEIKVIPPSIVVPGKFSGKVPILLLFLNCSKVVHRDTKKPFGHNGNLRSVSVERKDRSLSSEYLVNKFLMWTGASEFKDLFVAWRSL